MQGIRLVLIADLHEAPILHLNAKAFTASASDWSTQACFVGVQSCEILMIVGWVASRNDVDSPDDKLLESEELPLGTPS